MIKAIACLLLFVLTPELPAAGQDAEDRVTPGMNQFATEAYTRLARGEQNLIFSPFSLFTALSMALEGARGETAKEIAAVLHQPYPDPQYHAALAKTIGQLTKAANTNGTQLLNANGLWIDKGFRVQTAFRQTLENLYSSPPSQLDFSHNPESARAEINRWTGEQTKHKIPELFGPGALDRSTRLVMASAIYFKGKWQCAFPTQNTRPAPFHLSGGSTVEANFMNQSSMFGYAETPTVQILEMKYADGALAMEILIPKSPQGLGGLEHMIATGTAGVWFSEMQSRTVDVSLPKFRAESEFPLRDTLAAMGMPSAFSQTAADFTGIDDLRDLFLSYVIQKSFVDVEEER